MRVLSLIERVTDVAAFAGMAVLLPLVGTMVYEVFSRYVFSAPTMWAFEVSYMMMGAIFMFGMAYALKQRQHVSVDLIYLNLGPRTRAAIDIVGYAFLLPMVAWLTSSLTGYAIEAYRTGEVSGQSAWNPQIWPFRTIMAIGFAVFTLQILVETVRAAAVLAGADPSPSEPPQRNA